MDQPHQARLRATTSVAKTTLLIVSDVLLYREGLSASLMATAHLEVVGATTGAETVAQASALYPDVVLLDASLPDSLDLARELRMAVPGIRVVGFGVTINEEGILACAEAGLAEFVGKDGTAQDLAAAVERSVRGELRCSAQVASLLFSRVASLANRGGSPGPIANLTRREREIAVLVKEGMSNKEIAAALHIGPATVKNHVHKILEKLDARRRSAIAARLAGS